MTFKHTPIVPALKHFLVPVCLFLIVWSSCGRGSENGLNQDHPAETNRIRSVADTLLQAQGKKEAINYLYRAYENLKDPGPGDQYAKFSWLIEYYTTQVPDQHRALLCCDSAITILKIAGDHKTYHLYLIAAYMKRGDVLFRLNRYNEAYSSFYQSKMMLNKLKNTCDDATLLFNFYATLANVSYGQNRFSDAVVQQRHAIAAFDHCAANTGHALLIQGALDNIGLSFMLAGQPDSALAAYNSALNNIDHTKPATKEEKLLLEIARGVVLGNQGTTFASLKDTARAEQNFLKSIAINSRPGFATQDALVTRMKLANLYINTGRFAEAASLLQFIETARDTLPEPQDHLRLLLLKADYLKATGQPSAALGIDEQYIKQSNLLRKKTLPRLHANYDQEFELLEKRHDLVDLQRRHQLQTVYLIAIIMVCLLSGVLLLTVIRGRKRTRKHLGQIQNYNDQLEATMGDLETTVSENEKLMGIVAHDLKNPLGAIYSLTLLMREEATLSANDRESLEMITLASQNMTTIINELLAARLNKQPDIANRKDIDLMVLLSECVSLLQYKAREKGQLINLSGAESAWIFANRAKMWRVVNNLLVNAMKFSPKHKNIDVVLTREADMVTVMVRDHGIGIPPEMLDKLFDNPLEIRRTGTSGEESYGMGLPICRQIINDKGGRIWVESEVGKGTAVYFSIPVSKINEV